MKIFLGVLILIVATVAFLGFYVSDVPGESAKSFPTTPSDEEREVAKRLQAHVEEMAHRIGQRNIQRPAALAQARELIEGILRREGLAFTEQTFGGGDPGINIEAEIPGRGAAGEILVVGAHYDTAASTPGADDNATGCAALLELAARVPAGGYERTLRLVFFDRGSTRYAGTEESGSHAYALRTKSNGGRVVAMLSLDALGCYRSDAGSQDRPFPLGFFYPGRGDFVLFAGDLSSRDLVRQAAGAFRVSALVPAEGAALPCWFPGLSSSDHVAFSSAGWPAIVVTDSGTLRNHDIGLMTDMPDRLDFDRMARVVIGLGHVVEGLARRGSYTP